MKSLLNIFRTNSIKGLLFRLYLVIITLAGIGVFFIYSQMHTLDRQSYQIAGNGHQIQNYCNRIDADISYTAFLTYNHILLQQNHIKHRATEIWDNRVIPNTDSLKALVYTINNTFLIKEINELKKEILDLENLWNEIIDKKYYSDDSSNLYKFQRENQKYDLLINKIRKKLLNVSLDEGRMIRRAVLGIQGISHNIQNVLFFLILVILLLGFWLSFFVVNKLLAVNKNITIHLNKLIEGELPDQQRSTIIEVDSLVNVSNNLTDSFSSLKNLADEVGDGKFNTHIKVFKDKGVLGNALASMRESLQKISEDSLERNWYNEGFAKFGEILRNTSRDSKLFYESLIASLVTYLNVNQGGIFSLHEEKKESIMQLKACYAYERQKHLVKTILPGEGLIGQAWREKDMLYITDIPENYTEITSGLGTSKPKSLLIVPLITNQEVLGVVELASFHEIPTYKKAFVQQVSESIATTIAKLKTDTDTQQLLVESQEMAQKLQDQEKKIKQHIKELVLTKEKMELNAAEMRMQLEALDASFIMMELNIDGNFTQVNDLLLETSHYKREKLIGQPFSLLLKHRAEDQQVKQDWIRVMRGEYVTREILRYTKQGNHFWMYEVMYPLYDGKGHISKVSIVGYNITKQKEQEKKIKEQLNELQMSKRDVVNRIREVEGKARNKILKIQMELHQQIQEKDRIISELKE